jgi:hypothetical protein
MLDHNFTIVQLLKDHIRVNTSNKTVEVYDEYGVKMRLTNLSDEAFEAFASKFQNF